MNPQMQQVMLWKQQGNAALKAGDASGVFNPVHHAAAAQPGLLDCPKMAPTRSLNPMQPAIKHDMICHICQVPTPFTRGGWMRCLKTTPYSAIAPWLHCSWAG